MNMSGFRNLNAPAIHVCFSKSIMEQQWVKELALTQGYAVAFGLRGIWVFKTVMFIR